MMSDYLHFLDFIRKNTVLTGTFPGCTALVKGFLLQQLYSFLIKGYMKAAGRLATTSGFTLLFPHFSIYK